MNYRHIAAELRIYCGDDSLTALARELTRRGCQRAAVLCGRTVSTSSEMELLQRALGAQLVGTCSAVRTNSPVPAVEEAAAFLRDTKADAVIAVGGGSAAVTARAASILLAEARPAQDLSTLRLPSGKFESPSLEAPKLPQFVVPTTPSTAFVKVGSAVHDPQSGRRLALFDPKTRAKALFLHPAFLQATPAALVLEASLNTLSTAVEALLSPQCDPLSEAMLAHALRLIAQHLGNVESTTANGVAAREGLAVAAILCGRGTEQSGGGLSSVLAHAIGHRNHTANGLINAVVLPHTLRYNLAATQKGASLMAQALQSGAKCSETQHIEFVESLFATLSIPRRLRDIGVMQPDLSGIADAAMEDYFITRNPRPVTRASDVLEVLEQAW